jgi:DNA-3-methyladenine glycosylase
MAEEREVDVEVHIKRAYVPATPDDGYRVLIDRLWPRGVTKEAARLDLWLKEIAPSTELRKWYHGGEGDWDGFVARYRQELGGNPGAVARLRQIVASHPVVTLVYGSKDEERNGAAVLRELLEAR